VAYEQLHLPSSNSGQSCFIGVHSFGPTDGQKVYVQAGLHADEHPGLLVAQHLISELSKLDQQQQLQAHFVVVPFANPIGLRQRTFGKLTGRCDWHTGQNFNRGMGIDRDLINDEFMTGFGDDPHTNDLLMRSKLSQLIKNRQPGFEIEALHQLLLSLSIDAHYVIDLHCDIVALPHLFYGKHQNETGQLLAQCLHYPVCLEEDVTGTVAFDGSHTQPWVLAQQHTSQIKFHQPCFAATVELRGNTDVNEPLAIQDSAGLLTFFAELGLITRTHPAMLEPIKTTTVGVEQVKLINAPAPGIVVYHGQIGDHIQTGDLIAQIVLLDQETPSRTDIVAPCDGLLFSQTNEYYVSPGQTIAMLATNQEQNKAGSQLAF